MHLFYLFSTLITVAAVFAYINVRAIKLPAGISFIFLGTITSVILIIVGKISPAFTNWVKEELMLIDFSEFILGILLSFLLFAGSLHVNFSDLKKYGKNITIYAVVGTLISTFLMGGALYYLVQLFNLQIPFVYCLLFGALISPTDPIAVLGILKSTGLPKNVEVKVSGESLFNDGIGVVIFISILQFAQNPNAEFSALDITHLFAVEAVGGMLVGAFIGWLGFWMMRRIDHFQSEILITLAMVMGGYTLCHFIHVSGPLAMVVAGLITGNKSEKDAMSDITRDYVKKFWEVLDEILNALLFMLIGLEIIVLSFEWLHLLIGLVAALMLIVVRYIALSIPSLLFLRPPDEKLNKILTWFGLRGGISVALALSVPNNEYKALLVNLSVIIVLFSILLQGLTIEKVIKKLKYQ